MQRAAFGVRPRERSEHASSASPKRFLGKPWRREKGDREGWRPLMCSTTLRSGASAEKRSRMDSPEGSRICSKAQNKYVMKNLKLKVCELIDKLDYID